MEHSYCQNVICGTIFETNNERSVATDLSKVLKSREITTALHSKKLITNGAAPTLAKNYEGILDCLLNILDCYI